MLLLLVLLLLHLLLLHLLLLHLLLLHLLLLHLLMLLQSFRWGVFSPEFGKNSAKPIVKSP